MSNTNANQPDGHGAGATGEGGVDRYGLTQFDRLQIDIICCDDANPEAIALGNDDDISTTRERAHGVFRRLAARINELIADLTAAREEAAALREGYEKLAGAARVFIDRHADVTESDEYRSVWTIHQLHNGPYSGPQYKDELVALRETLLEIESHTARKQLMEGAGG